MKTNPKFFFLALCLFQVGCGYRVNEEFCGRGPETSSLCIPYVNNDMDGQLTDELIKAFSTSGRFIYQTCNAALELNVKIIAQDNKSLGWRYNRTSHGKRNKDLISTEGRRHVDAEVTLIDTMNDEVLLGPIVVGADLDFDYYEPDSIRDLSFIDSAGVKQTSVAFSLGQLDSTEGAYDAAWTPLSRLLSKKILDVILRASYY